MFLQFDLESHKVVHWIQAKKITISATDKDVLLNILRLEVAHRNSASHCLVPQWHDLILLLERIQIQDVDLFVWTIAE